jgi:hypothetical protein
MNGETESKRGQGLSWATRNLGEAGNGSLTRATAAARGKLILTFTAGMEATQTKYRYLGKICLRFFRWFKVQGFQIRVEDPGRLFPFDAKFVERGGLLAKNLLVPTARKKAGIGAKEQALGAHDI